MTTHTPRIPAALLAVPVTALLAALLAAPQAARACAACACGDPTLTVMGTGKGFAGRLRLSAEYRRRSETVPGPFGTDRVIEDRLAVGFAWAPLDRLQVAATVPLVGRSLETATLARDEALHIGDAELLGRVFLIGVRGRDTHQLGLTAGLRLPTGPEVSGAAGPLPLDAQPGSGGVMPSVGAWYAAFAHPWSAHLSVNGMASSEGHQGFAPGLAGLATAFGQYQWATPAGDLALRLGADGRLSARDEQDGAEVAASGGATVFAMGGLVYSPITDVLLHGTLRWPAYDDRRGGERAEPSLSVGLTHDL